MFFQELLWLKRTMQHHLKTTDRWLSADYRDPAIQAAFIRNRYIPGIYVVAGLSFGMLVSTRRMDSNSGEISVGQFIAFLLISTRMTMPLFIRLVDESTSEGGQPPHICIS